MGEVYDLHQQTHMVIIYIKKTKVCFGYYSTTKKDFTRPSGLIQKDTCITYDKQKMNIKSWGEKHSESDDEGDENIRIDNFRDGLYQLFKKDKDEWNKDDLFLLKAVSDFIQLLVKLLIETSEGKLKSTDQLHYALVVPSEWKEEIRETLLRPILIQSNVISKNDHNDRLLFCSDLESIFYNAMVHSEFDFEKIRKTILCRFACPVSENEMLLKLDLVSTVNRLFDFPEALLFPHVERSNSLSVTINTFTDGIRAFIKDELPLAIQDEVIQIIMDKKDKKKEKKAEDKEDEEDEEYYLNKPLITDTSRWELDKRQLDFIRSICVSDICSQIYKNITNSIDNLLSNDVIKKYHLLFCVDLFSSVIYPNEALLNWSKLLLKYNRTYSRNENIISTLYSDGGEADYEAIMKSVCRYGQDVINNANIYSKPRILPVKNSANSSSVFQELKPGAIMNIDISIEFTMLSFSLLDENGFIKEVWNHDDFLIDKSLCSLGSFFSFSETTTTLKAKSSFIEFAKDNFMDNVSFLYGDKNNGFLQLNATKIEAMLCKDSDVKDILVSTQQQIYIKSFLLLYMLYIKYVISSKLSDIINSSTEIKIGYSLTVEKILLNRLFGTKEGLRDIIYASGLIQKDDNSKKLRIITEGERILHLLQRLLSLPFPLNSFFVLSQFHENYIQLTLNKVVTEFSSSEEDQEAVIIHDRIIHIPNIYTSLCLNMWNNIVEDNSLIQLCNRHKKCSSDGLLELLSLENKTGFIKNLEQYISKDNLSNNPSQPATDKINIQLSASCNCRVYLTARDIIDISLQPVLQDMMSLVSASFINKELFGKFWNIQYLFQLIQFDYNTQLHDSLIKMLKETTEDVFIERGVDIPQYVIPRSLNQLLQPIIYQQPISYKEFRVGTLHHVYGDGYGFGFHQGKSKLLFVYKSKTTDTKSVSVGRKTIFPLFKKGDIINDLSTNLTCYLSSQLEVDKIKLRIKYFKLKVSCDLNSDGTVCLDDVGENIFGHRFITLSEEFKTGQDKPIRFSVFYEAYSGSLALRANVAGQDIGVNKFLRLGIPMHLSRF